MRNSGNRGTFEGIGEGVEIVEFTVPRNYRDFGREKVVKSGRFGVGKHTM